MRVDINGLRQKRGQTIKDMEALLASADAESRDLTADEAKKYDELKASDDKLQADIARAEDFEKRKAAMAKPIDSSGLPTSDDRVYPQAKSSPVARAKGENFACLVRSMAATKGIHPLAAKFAGETLKNDEVAMALSASSGSAGGFLVPEAMSSEIIELLRPASVVRALNPLFMDLPNGNITMPGIAGGATASYVSEQANIPKSEVTFRQVKLVSKKLAALVPISNDLIRYPSQKTDMVVRDDCVAAVAQRSDLAFIRGDGTQDTPIGLRSLVQATNVFTANATVNLANVRSDLGKLMLALKNSNCRFLRPGFMFSPRTEEFLMNLTDANGNLVYADQMDQGKLRRLPYKTTTQIPNNLGGGSNESEIYLVDFADFVIGDAFGIEISVSDVAAYHDGTQLQAPFSRDETVVKVLTAHDCNLRQLASVAVLTGVTWTP